MIDSYTDDGDDIVEFHCDNPLCYNRKTFKNPTREDLEDTGWYQVTVEHGDGSVETLEVLCPRHANKKYG